MTVACKLRIESWEDGELVRRELDTFDRWAVHAAGTVEVTIGDVTVTIVQKPHAINATRVGVGACLWEGAVALAAYLGSQPTYRYVGARCVELGAGVGLVGMHLAKLGAKAVLTDLRRVLPLLHENVAANSLAASSRTQPGEGSCEVAELEWGAEGYLQAAASLASGGVDFVVAADCCYVDQELFEATGSSPSTEDFIRAAAALCGPRSRCLVAFELRSSAVKQHFLAAAAAHFARVTRITLGSSAAEQEAQAHIELYELRKEASPA